MKPFVINKNSWNYKFMNRFPSSGAMDAVIFSHFHKNYWYYDEDTGEKTENPILRKKGFPYSICDYTRRLILLSLGILFLSLLAMIPVAAIVIDIVNTHPHSSFLSDIQFIGNLIIFLGGIALGIDRLEYWLENRKSKKIVPQKEPGFVRTAWKNYKQKTCIPVEFK